MYVPVYKMRKKQKNNFIRCPPVTYAVVKYVYFFPYTYKFGGFIQEVSVVICVLVWVVCELCVCMYMCDPISEAMYILYTSTDMHRRCTYIPVQTCTAATPPNQFKYYLCGCPTPLPN